MSYWAWDDDGCLLISEKPITPEQKEAHRRKEARRRARLRRIRASRNGFVLWLRWNYHALDYLYWARRYNRQRNSMYYKGTGYYAWSHKEGAKMHVKNMNQIIRAERARRRNKGGAG